MPETQLGQALLDVPMDQILERMARAIAMAQRRLDEVSIATAIELGNSTLDLHDAGGVVVTRSLLELGFLPTFYQFVDTTIDVSVALSIRTGEDVTAGGTIVFGTSGGGRTGATGTSVSATTRSSAGPTGPAGPAGPTSGPVGASGGTQGIINAALGAAGTIFGVTLSAEYTRRYQYDSSAGSKVSTKMVTVPAPPAFLQALKTNFGIAAG